jgi:hypothetical protein
MDGMQAILTTTEIMERYRISKRAARNLINDAGGFLVGGKLVIREDDLAEWEEAQKALRLTQLPQVIDCPPRRPLVPIVEEQLIRDELKDGWWRD